MLENLEMLKNIDNEGEIVKKECKNSQPVSTEFELTEKNFEDKNQLFEESSIVINAETQSNIIENHINESQQSVKITNTIETKKIVEFSIDKDNNCESNEFYIVKTNENLTKNNEQNKILISADNILFANKSINDSNLFKNFSFSILNYYQN